MAETKETESGMPEVFGFIGVMLAIVGMSDISMEPRLIFLLGSAICLPISFTSQPKWPPWVRWLLSLAANCFLAFVAWSAIRSR